MSNPPAMKMLREASDPGCFVEQMQYLPHGFLQLRKECQWIRLEAPTAEAWVQPLVGGLRPHVAQCVPQKQECLPAMPVVISPAFPSLYFIPTFSRFLNFF